MAKVAKTHGRAGKSQYIGAKAWRILGVVAYGWPGSDEPQDEWETLCEAI